MADPMEIDDLEAAEILAGMNRDEPAYLSSTEVDEDIGATYPGPCLRQSSLRSTLSSQYQARHESFLGIPVNTPTASTFSKHFKGLSVDKVEFETLPPFSIFEALLCHEDILLYITTQHMEPRDLFLLYRISKSFHYVVNCHITSYVLSSARRWARLTHFRPSNVLLEPSTRIVRTSDTEKQPKSRRPGTVHPTASDQAMRACGTEPTPLGTYSPHDITTLFPFHNYIHLCAPDPTLRKLTQAHEQTSVRPLSNPTTSWMSATASRDQTSHSANTQSAPPSSQQLPESSTLSRMRHIPTFRYLRFLLFRASKIQLIITSLLRSGHRLPVPLTPSVLAKMWFTLDLPTNNRRLALLRNTAFFDNRDLYIAQLVFVKLDMAFTDPVDGDGETSLRKLLLAQRSLSVLADTLARNMCRNTLEVLQLWARVHYRPPLAPCPVQRPEVTGQSVLGVPAAELGRLGVEGWGRPISAEQSARSGVPVDWTHRTKLLRADELVVAEAVRRRLPLHQRIVDMMLYGYVDWSTGMDLPREPTGGDEMNGKCKGNGEEEAKDEVMGGVYDEIEDQGRG